MNTLKVTLASFLLAALFSVSSHAGETADKAETSCLRDLKLPGAVCTCIGQSAEKDLNNQQQKFFITVIQNDVPAREALRRAITADELNQVAAFMNTAPEKCGG